MFINKKGDIAKPFTALATAQFHRLNSRRARISLGVGLIFVGLYLALPHVIYYTSIDALVNAHVMSLHTPIEGVVEGKLPMPGQPVKSGDTVATVRNDRVNRSFLGELHTERESLQRRIAALIDQIDGLERLKAHVAERRIAFEEATLRDLAAAIGEQKATLKAQQAVLLGKEHILQRRQELLRTGTIAPQTYDDAVVDRDQARAIAEATERTIERLAAQKQSAGAGVFLGTGGNDEPYTQQRSDEIQMHLLDLTARRQEQETRVAEIDRQIAAEETRLAQVQESRLAAPNDAIVWRVLAQPSKEVQTGSEIAQLLDCRSGFIDALASESRFDMVKPGDSVRYRLVGASGFKEGRVAAVRGVAAANDDRTLAAKLDAARSNEFHVLIEPDPADLRVQSASYCDVGRHAEVRLPQRVDLFGPFKAIWDVI